MDPSFTGTILGDYEIRESIGRGGMGVVYRARQLSLDRPVAMKLLPPEHCTDREYVNRFLQEARAAANLNHPNIIQVFDAGVANGIYFFVMEFMDGKNLGQVVRERGCLEEYEALSTIYEVTKGLVCAHSKGIIHRDVKPENIMLASHQAVKIGDLGLVKWNPKEKGSALTEDGTSLGTPYYISPEQIRGGKDVDGRSDIYSLGMTLDHLLRGQPAFMGGTAAEVMAQHLSDEIPPLPLTDSDLSEPTLQLLADMTAKNREKRIQQMSDVALVISEILRIRQEGTPSRHHLSAGRRQRVAEQEDLPSRLWKMGVRILVFVSAVVVGLALALGIVMFWNSYHPQVKPTVSSGLMGPDHLSQPSAKAVDQAASISSSEPDQKPPDAPSEKRHKSVFGDLKFKEIRGFRNLQALVMSSNSNRLEEDWKRLSKFEIFNMERIKSKVLIRVHFEKVEGMSTWEDFIHTVDECESATLVLWRGGPLEGGDVKVEARDLLKPWGQNVPLLSQNLVEKVRETFKIKVNQSKQTGSFTMDLPVKDGKAIRHFVKALDEETNWNWASHSQSIPWGKEGAEEYGVDCGEETLRMYSDREEIQYGFPKESAQRMICFDVLPSFRSHARKIQAMGSFIPHDGWIIGMIEPHPKSLALAGIFYDNSPLLILKRK